MKTKILLLSLIQTLKGTLLAAGSADSWNQYQAGRKPLREFLTAVAFVIAIVVIIKIIAMLRK